jgi:DNA excision repair protein ERCC-2
MELKISVRDIIEYVYRNGDIRALSLGTTRAVDGTKAHQRIQKRFAKEYDQYQAEVSVRCQVSYAEVSLDIGGRIDGLFEGEECPVIDEIKSTGAALERIEPDVKHWAQGKMYAYIIAKERELNEICVQLTYVQLGTFEIRQFQESYTWEDLEKFFQETVEGFLVLARKIAAYQKSKLESIGKLTFPYEGYRRGQRKLMNGVYQSVMEDKKLFVRAPTGIGKTLGTLYPAIKTLPLMTSKIFYLTAKTIGRDVALSALDQLEERGLILKRINITAKDKICLNDEKVCDAEFCPYAAGHFDRINDALIELIDATHRYDRKIILEYAKRYQVCPYELTLDLTLYCDCVICDYNYAFDPSSSLKRYFSDDAVAAPGAKEARYIFLIDEAHNLIDRARHMYSSELSKRDILDLKKKVKGKDGALHRYLTKMNKFLIDRRKDCSERGFLVEESCPEEFSDLARGVVYRTEKVYSRLSDWEHSEALLDFYFECRDFLKKTELYDSHYRTYYEKQKNELVIKLFCIDPQKNLRESMDKAQSAVLFSATLSPLDYFKKALGGEESSYGLILESPFDPDNLLLMVQNHISTKFRDRVATAEKVAESILQVARGKKGNYIAFFPSYRYLEEVYGWCEKLVDEGSLLMKQQPGQSEAEKEAFLGAFDVTSEKTMVAFAVLGGMFAEGIDLRGDRLSGAVVVGVALPPSCLERDLIKEYFDGDSGDGFRQAYILPGMNKVLQASGRVIRQETDRGIILLIGSRFAQSSYKSLFPPEWHHAKRIAGKLEQEIMSFWAKNGEDEA